MTIEGDSSPDGYIAVRLDELAQALAGDIGAEGHVAALLTALMRYEGQKRLDALKALYDPLDPDSPPPRRDQSLAAFEAFEAALTQELAHGNFIEIEPDSVRTAKATTKLTGLAIKPSLAGIRRIRYFARGARIAPAQARSWFGLRKQTIEVETMRDVVVLVGFKSEDEISKADEKAFARMRRGVRPGAALVKHFRDVASPELVTLHPGARPSMRGRDQVILAAPALVAGTPVLLNLWPALTVLFAVLAAYFGAQGVIEESQLKRALAAMSGLVAVGAFVMRQRLKYEAQTLRYQKQLADTVYFRNLANNAGVIDLLVGAGAEQEAKEALLAYACLHKAGRALSREEIDSAAEELLRERFGLAVNFEICDALDKLERLGLVTRPDERHYQAVPPDDALARLDAAWDSLFQFSARR